MVLLPPNPNPLKYPVKAYAWLIMGVGCQLHYQIMIQGRTTTLSEPLNAYLTNSDGHINSPHTSENTSIMGNFYDNVVSRNQTFYYLVIYFARYDYRAVSIGFRFPKICIVSLPLYRSLHLKNLLNFQNICSTNGIIYIEWISYNFKVWLLNI